jgi:serine protease Do
MKHFKKVAILAVTFLSVGLSAGLILSTGLDMIARGYAQDNPISKESIDILSRMNRAVSDVVAAVKPAVVNISSTKTVRMQGAPLPFFNDPFFREFFGHPFPGRERQREQKQSGAGSGVVVAKNGYILTNHHVIEGADEITVRLSDKRVFTGKVIGVDQKTDLAVIKIDADHLPVLPFGNSDQLKVGDMVIAIGNPFGLSQTVTTGIISAKGRADVGLADYEDFIQTDAAINPGNSGGALVNVKGELIGINTAILSSSGGYQGIGFAIPARMAEVVMDSLIKKGKMVRGWLGVSIQPLTQELAKSLV